MEIHRPEPSRADQKKANHAPLGDTVHLGWQRGLLVRDGIAEPDLNRPPAEDVFLTILDAVIGEGQIVLRNREPAISPL